MTTTTMLPEGEFPSYDGDHFPEHWPQERQEQSRKYYRAVPEEFYTKSGRRPITPKKVKSWMSSARGRGLRFQFWEWCSGSGRLSFLLMMANGKRSNSAPREDRPQLGDLEDPTAPFKLLARSGDYSKVILTRDPDIFLSADNALLLKAAMVQLVESCIGIFSEVSGVDYGHWLDGPVLFRIFQEIFSSQMHVLGVMCSLRPWHSKVPDPQLSSSCAPLRLLLFVAVFDVGTRRLPKTCA